MRWIFIGLCLLLPAFADVSVEQEAALGRQAAQKIEAQIGLDNSPQLNQRLQSVGQALARVSDDKQIQFQFKVLATDDFNAMALPGGYVYATRGLIQGMSDGELAFVLGHEISHVVQHHSLKQMEGEQMRQLGLLAVLLGLGGGRVNRQSAQLAGLADKILSSRFSQADEAEADRLGTAMMTRAGYDPAYALIALHTLAGRHNTAAPAFINAMLGSHPLPQERITDAYSYIPALSYQTALQVAKATVAREGPIAAKPLQERLLQAVVQSSGWKQDTAMMHACSNQLKYMNLDAQGFLLVSPAGESDNALERRLLTQGVAGILLFKGGSRFGLALRPGLEGERLVWLKVR